MTLYNFCNKISIIINSITSDNSFSLDKVKCLCDRYNSLHGVSSSFISSALGCLLFSIELNDKTDIGIYIAYNSKVHFGRSSNNIIWDDFDGDFWISLDKVLGNQKIFDDALSMDETIFSLMYRRTEEVKSIEENIYELNHLNIFSQALESLCEFILLAEGEYQDV